MDVTRMALEDLNPDPENTNTHGERNIEVIKNSLRQWGQYRAYVVQKHSEALGLDNVIIVGNGMYEAMKELGTFSSVAVEVLDIPDEERRALSIQDNKSSDLSEFDEDKLGEMLRELPVENVLLTGFDKAELAEFDVKLDGDLWGPGADESDEEEKIPPIVRGATLEDLAPSDEELEILRGKKIVVQFSGGKDSSASALWCERYLPDNEKELLFCDLGADFVGFDLHLRRFAEATGMKLVVIRSEHNVIEHILNKGKWPHFLFPYCRELLNVSLDSYHKVHNPGDMIVVAGGRLEERAKGGKKSPTRWKELKAMPGYRYFNPLYFTDKEAAERILEESGAPVWEGYGRGLKRTACRMCPGQRPVAYAAIRREFPEVWGELLEMQRLLGTGVWQGAWTGDGRVPSFEEMADKGEVMLEKEQGAD